MAALRIPSKFICRLGLQERLGVLICVLIILAGLTLSVIGYRMVVSATAAGIKESIEDLTARSKMEITHNVRRPVMHAIDRFGKSPLAHYVSLEERLSYLPLISDMLNECPFWGGVYVGYANGDLFAVLNLAIPEQKNTIKAPSNAAFLVGHISGSGSSRYAELLFYDDKLSLVLRRPGDKSRFFDPRKRSWFMAAMRAEDVVEIPFHKFFGTGHPGIVFARKNPRGDTVIGVGIYTSQLTAALQKELPTPGSRLALLRPDGALIASTQGMIVTEGGDARLRTVADLMPVMRKGVWDALAGVRARGIEVEDGGRIWELSLENLNNNGANGEPGDIMVLAIPREELLAGGMRFLRHASFGIAGVLLFCLPFVWLMARPVVTPLRSLAATTDSLSSFLENDHQAVASSVPEIQALAEGLGNIRTTFHKLMSITHTLSSEREFEPLMRDVLREILLLARIDGSMAALLDDGEGNSLREYFAYWLIDGQETANRYVAERSVPNSSLAVYRALEQDAVIRESISRDDPRSDNGSVRPGFADPEVTNLDLVAIPLRDRTGEKLGVLVLYKTVKPDKAGFQPAEAAFAEIFADAVSIALENRRLLKGQKDLRNAFIHILAGAIDAKSPPTGGHCQRVPILFQMLLTAACEADEGPLKGFTLDEQGWEEVRLAAWLHDCGKVATPEYVMEKATKLETLYDRIHEIRTRFEVLKRDAVIRCQKAMLKGADPERARRVMKAEHRALDDDFAFVASCNSGGAAMSDEVLKRLAAIGGRTWLRTLDKRLGVSRAELARMNRKAQPTLPVREPLLMDNLEHIIDRGEKDILPPGNSWGFKLSPPPALYNRGELYNLSIREGTLTREERYKINDHITQTIIMLSAMPLPGHLRNVVEIAGAHHETMDGGGYPKGLTREEMSWSARMLAVVDIFEAITAGDRPYQQGKTLRKSLEIMEELKERNHIDPDVYDMFLKAGIPQRYASKFLKPEQNDL